MVNTTSRFIIEIQDRWNVRVTRSGHIMINYASIDATKFIIEHVEGPYIDSPEEIVRVMEEHFESLPENLEEYDLPPIEDQPIDDDLLEIAEQIERRNDKEFTQETREYTNQVVNGGVRTVLHGAAEEAIDQERGIVDAIKLDNASERLYDLPITLKWA